MIKIINKYNYKIEYNVNNAYIQLTKNRNLILADIKYSDNKVIVQYHSILINFRPDIKYYSYDNYKKYINYRAEDFFNNYEILINDKGDFKIIRRKRLDRDIEPINNEDINY